MERLPGLTSSALAIAAALASGCGGGGSTEPPDTPPSLGLTTEDRARLEGALILARELALRGLGQPGSAEPVSAAFAEAALRVAADDRAGTERAIVLAGDAVRDYRTVPGGDVSAAGPDLEAMDLTVESATALIARQAGL